MTDDEQTQECYDAAGWLMATAREMAFIRHINPMPDEFLRCALAVLLERETAADNTYHASLASRLEALEERIRVLEKPSIPAPVKAPDVHEFKFHGVKYHARTVRPGQPIPARGKFGYYYNPETITLKQLLVEVNEEYKSPGWSICDDFEPDFGPYNTSADVLLVSWPAEDETP